MHNQPKPGGRPRLPDDVAARGVIHIRTTMSRKGAYVRAASQNGEKLTGWMFRHLDKAAGYEPGNEQLPPAFEVTEEEQLDIKASEAANGGEKF